jgi:hypothetical protein
LRVCHPALARSLGLATPQEGAAMGSTVDPDLARKTTSLLDQLDIPEPFELPELCRRAGRIWLDATVYLIPWPAAPLAMCGLWILGSGERGTPIAHLLYDAAAEGFHRDQLVFHELGHAALGHTGIDQDLLPVIHDLFPGLNPNAVRARGRFDEREEAEAEYFGDELGLRIDAARTRPSQSPATEPLSVRDRIEAALDPHTRPPRHA